MPGARAAVAQRVTMSTALSAEKASLIVQGQVTPVQQGRRVALQRSVPGGWQELTATRTRADGSYGMWLHGAHAGSYLLRTVAEAKGALPRYGSAPRWVQILPARAFLADLPRSAGVPFKKGTVRLGGQDFPKSLFNGEGADSGMTYGARWDVAYNLAGRWRTFRTTVGVLNPDYGPMGVEIVADGRTLLRRTLLSGQVLPVRYDVRGVRTLRLTVAQGSYRGYDGTNDTAFATAVVMNDTVVGNIPSTTGTTYMSDLTPRSIQPAGATDNGLAYPGDPPGNLAFGSAVDVTLLEYVLPPGHRMFTARLGQWDECQNDAIGLRVIGDGALIASYPFPAPLEIRVPIEGVEVLQLEATLVDGSFNCPKAIADGRLLR